MHKPLQPYIYLFLFDFFSWHNICFFGNSEYCTASWIDK